MYQKASQNFLFLFAVINCFYKGTNSLYDEQLHWFALFGGVYRVRGTITFVDIDKPFQSCELSVEERTDFLLVKLD